MSRRLFSILSILFTIFIVACDQETPTPTQEPSSPLAVSFQAPTHVPTVTPSAPKAPLSPLPVPAQAPTFAPLRVWVEKFNGYLPWEPFTLHFNQPMKPGQGGIPLRITPQIAGKPSWNNDHTRLTFTPDEGFEPGRSYHIVLTRQLQSATGAVFEPAGWRIRVLEAPRVERRQPALVQIDERQPTIRLAFNRDMDPESLVAALSVEPDVALDLRYESQALYIEPLEPLTPGTSYNFRLDQSARDVRGIPLERCLSWHYRLADLIADTSWPARQGDRSTPLVIRFNYPVDTASVRRALNIQPSIEGELSWNAQRTVATFTPAAPLPSETRYTVRFDAPLQDSEGARLSTPGPLRFTTPPPILDVNPALGGFTHPDTTVQVTFDRLMDHEKTAAALEITPTLPGDFQWHETTLTFQPEGGYLQEFTTYTVTIAASASDPDGVPVLRAPYTWSFRTGEVVDLADFGWGPNAQVVDADGRRMVQFGVLKSIATPLNFELYRLSLEQFLDRYASGFRGVAGRQERPVSTEGTTLVKRWQIEFPERRDRSVQEVHIPDDVPPGLYVLNLTTGHVNDQLILVLSRNTIALKQAEGHIAAWVSDINGGSVINGDGASDVEVSVYARDGQLLSQGRADQNGVYRAQVSRDPQPLIVVARDGDDITAAGLSNEWRSRYGGQWEGWWRPAPVALDYAAHIYTDRPIYRPGQTVFFKGILRHDDDAALSPLAQGLTVTTRIRDARNNVVQTLGLTTNHFGTVHGEFELAQGAMLGEYAVEMVLEGESHRQVFKVEDYRKPDYQVGVTTDAQRYVVGDPIRVNVDSRYFFGEPVPNARLVVKQYKLLPRYWWEQGDDDLIWYASQEREIKGTTDANGRFALTLYAKMDHHAREVYWRSNLEQATWGIEVTVDDGSHQTVSSFAVVQVFNAAEKMRLDTGGYLKGPGQPFTVRAEVA
ncbi:MAG: Ig-like domain-containing protein, partial [Anaerolineae bacterium]